MQPPRRVWRGGWTVSHREGVDRLGVQMLARMEHRGGKGIVVHAVGEHLGLQADGAVGGHHCAALARALREGVGGVELHAGQGGVHVHDYACLGAGQLGGMSAGEHHVVVEAAEEGGLLVRAGERLAQHLAAAEVKGGACDGRQTPRGQAVGSALAEILGVQRQAVGQYVAAAVEVEVGVVREAYGGGRVCVGVVAYAQLVGVRELKANPDAEAAGETLFAVGGHAGEHQPVGQGLRLPDVLVKAADAAVQRVFPVVAREGVLPATKREGTLRNPVADAAYGRAQVSAVSLVFRNGVVAQRDVHKCAGAVRHQKALYSGAVVEYYGPGPGGAADFICRDGLSSRRLAEGAACNFHG